MAWAKLAGRRLHEAEAGREREKPLQAPTGDEPALAQEGFAEEALPWLDAVYRFALRLTKGDEPAADDLAQETFLRAYRFWDTFERGTNAKSWLFTICRNTYLHDRDKARNRHEWAATDLERPVEALSPSSAFGRSVENPEETFFGSLIDDEVIEAIDELIPEYRDTLVLSDLGDLNYAEISEVLDIPIGTVRSRLFRARRLLQDRLRDFAARSGILSGRIS
jgi:RNA polymerase sigma-70 factor (ECF subfamily)